MIMGITGMTGVICLKGNRHFRIIDADDTFKSEPKKRWLVYRHSDRASLQMIAELGVLCVIVFVVMTVVKPVDRYFTDTGIAPSRKDRGSTWKPYNVWF